MIKRICLLLCVLATLANAAPTLYGPSGLITIPTAESLSYKEFNLGLDYFYDQDTEAYSALYKMNLGTFKGWELGFVGGRVPTEGVYINAKYYLMSDDSRYPLSIAIGIQNLTSNSDTDVYMVSSKRFEKGFIGHFGFNANFNEQQLETSIMGGIEYIFSDSFSILSDVEGVGSITRLNGGVRFHLNDHLQMRASVVNVGNNEESSFFTVGIVYTDFI